MTLVLTEAVTGAQVFNNLPPHLEKVDSIVIFKTQHNDIIF